MDKTIIVLSVLLVCSIYLLWAFMQVRQPKKDKNKINEPEVKRNKGDIVGKSQYVPLQPVAIVPKEVENPDIFIPPNEEKPTVQLPPEEVDKAFSDTPPNEDDKQNIDFTIEEDGEYNEIDEEESEVVEGAAQAMLATGLSFDELPNAVETADKIDNATPEQKEKAGEIFLQIRKTDVFEQIISGNTDRSESVTSLIDGSINALWKRIEARSEQPEKQNKRSVPADFKMSDFI